MKAILDIEPFVQESEIALNSRRRRRLPGLFVVFTSDDIKLEQQEHSFFLVVIHQSYYSGNEIDNVNQFIQK